jgi:hypothetical protein
MDVHLFPVNVTTLNAPPQGLESEVPQTLDDVEAEGKEALVDEDVNNEGLFRTQASVHSFISLGMPTQLTQLAASIMDNDIDTGLFVFQMSFFIKK